LWSRRRHTTHPHHPLSATRGVGMTARLLSSSLLCGASQNTHLRRRRCWSSWKAATPTQTPPPLLLLRARHNNGGGGAYTTGGGGGGAVFGGARAPAKHASRGSVCGRSASFGGAGGLAAAAAGAGAGGGGQAWRPISPPPPQQPSFHAQFVLDIDAEAQVRPGGGVQLTAG
jgi:hypothetical protein